MEARFSIRQVLVLTIVGALAIGMSGCRSGLSVPRMAWWKKDDGGFDSASAPRPPSTDFQPGSGSRSDSGSAYGNGYGAVADRRGDNMGSSYSGSQDRYGSSTSPAGGTPPYGYGNSLTTQGGSSSPGTGYGAGSSSSYGSPAGMSGAGSRTGSSPYGSNPSPMDRNAGTSDSNAGYGTSRPPYGSSSSTNSNYGSTPYSGSSSYGGGAAQRSPYGAPSGSPSGAPFSSQGGLTMPRTSSPYSSGSSSSMSPGTGTGLGTSGPATGSYGGSTLAMPPRSPAPQSGAPAGGSSLSYPGTGNTGGPTIPQTNYPPPTTGNSSTISNPYTSSTSQASPYGSRASDLSSSAGGSRALPDALTARQGSYMPSGVQGGTIQTTNYTQGPATPSQQGAGISTAQNPNSGLLMPRSNTSSSSGSLKMPPSSPPSFQGSSTYR